tara:strand:- start:1092 stop:2960 length:1869 start_codon:yes stop_codon:yes gene_type:complete
MAIKIPRSEKEIPSVGNRGSSILQAAQSNKINYNAFTNDLTNIAQNINAHNEKIEDARRKNKTTKHNSIMAGDVVDFTEEISIGKYNDTTKTYDAFTKEEIDKKHKKFESKMIGKYKNNVFKNDPAWEVFESYFYGNLTDANSGAFQVTKQKILADTAIAHTAFKTRQDINISNVVANDVMWEKMKFFIEQEKQMFSTTQNAGVANIDLEANINSITQRFLVKAIEGTHKKVLENGENGHDWIAIRKEINNKETDYYGKTLTTDERKGLLEYVKGKATEQTFFENKWVSNNNTKLFDNNIKNITDGKMKISQIKDLDFRQLDGEKLKNGLIDIATKVQLGEYGDESNIDNFLEIRTGILNGTITSLTEDITLKSDESNTEGQNILERVGTSIGNNDFERLNTVLQNKDNKRWGKDYQQLQKLVSAYQPQIEGIMKKYDLNAPVRVYELETELENEFFKQLKNGKTVNQLLDPKSSDFILKPELLQKYVLSVSEQAKQVAEQMSEKKSTGIYEGPMWPDYQEKYNNDIMAFKNGIEMQNYSKTESGIAYYKNKNNIKMKIEKNVAIKKGFEAKDKKIEALRKLNIKQKDVEQMTIDLDKLNSADFRSKYKVMKEQFKKAIKIK